jgi:hypothetical protein
VEGIVGSDGILGDVDGQAAGVRIQRSGANAGMEVDASKEEGVVLLLAEMVTKARGGKRAEKLFMEDCFAGGGHERLRRLMAGGAGPAYPTVGGFPVGHAVVGLMLYSGKYVYDGNMFFPACGKQSGGAFDQYRRGRLQIECV